MQLEAYEVTFQFKGSKTKFMRRVKEFQNSGAMTGFSELDKRIEGRPNMVKMTFKSKGDFNKFNRYNHFCAPNLRQNLRFYA